MTGPVERFVLVGQWLIAPGDGFKLTFYSFIGSLATLRVKDI